MHILPSIIETIGNTPLVRLNKVSRETNAQIIAKVEFFNPGGSVKDRIGVQILDDAEADGLIKPGGTIVEATSGNTGVGLAIAAALRGYKSVFVMPDKMSQEKIQLLRAFGARVVITPTDVQPEDPRSYYSVAQKIADETPNAILANQYHNPANPKSHELTTGPEIWDQTGGKIDVFVAGVGTGGTITGTARYLKKMNPDIKVVGVDPIGSILHDHLKTGAIVDAHSYKIEGIGEDFIPTTYDHTLLDDMIQVNDKDSFLMTRRLVREEGIFCGVSSGSAVLGAVRYAVQQKLGKDKMVVVIIPDSGSRYLSKAFNDDWMRENQLLDSGWMSVTASEVLGKSQNPVLVTAQNDDSVESVIDKMREYGVSQVPVLDAAENLVGLVREVNLLNYMLHSETGTNPAEVALRDTDVISADAATISVDTPLDSISDIFNTHSAAIVMANGKVANILTKIDLIDYLAHNS